MTVKELIEELEKVEDKAKEIMFIGHNEDAIIGKIVQEEDQVNLFSE
jgi:UDP-2,3-diacylglucosamine pyrophosphatase LpxH